jgi:serine/threonine-protein kinase HipA
VNGKRQNITADDFLAVAKQMNIKKAAKIVKQISLILQDWKKYAGEVGVEVGLRRAIQKTIIKIL